TLNIGLRYDVQLIPQPAQPNTLTPLTTLYTSTLNIDKNNFAPRFGAAWSIGKGTVLRAGYGIFYGKTTNSTYYATRVENGVIQHTFNVPFYTTRINTNTGPILTGVSDVNSWYNSFVLTFRKRMSGGVEFVTNYTLAKATDCGQVPGQFGTFNGTDSPIDPY